MVSILNLIGRTDALFTQDISQHEAELSRIVSDSVFLYLVVQALLVKL